MQLSFSSITLDYYPFHRAGMNPVMISTPPYNEVIAAYLLLSNCSCVTSDNFSAAASLVSHNFSYADFRKLFIFPTLCFDDKECGVVFSLCVLL